MKVEFLNELVIKPYRATPASQWLGGRWILESDFIIRITDKEGVGHLVTIPKGFKTDFASVPVFFHRIINPLSAMEASIPHDYFYRTGLLTKSQADRVFHLGMVELGVKTWKRQAMYRAVQWFGSCSYNKFTEEKLPIEL